MKWDLLLRNADVLDPGLGLRGRRDIAVAAGAIAAVEPSLEPPELQPVPTIDLGGRIAVPGLIDLHAHLFAGVSHYGVEPDRCCLRKGVTTAVDAGSAGVQTFPAFREVASRSATRVRALLNLSSQGMLIDGAGELEDLRYVEPRRVVQVCRENPELIVGLKVRLTPTYVGGNAAAALAAVIEAAAETGLPVMVHPNESEVPLSDMLAALRPGDVLTHCYHGRGNGILDARRTLLPAVRDAHERGVLFDVGHGMGSFSFAVARAALEQGFAPDTISTDIHTYSLRSPAVDLATTMTKFLHLGMPLEDCVRRVTSAPASVFSLGRGLGTLAAGSPADVTVLEVARLPAVLRDCENVEERTDEVIVPVLCIKGGEVVALDAANGDPSLL
jgi:dihydroorotase